MGPIVVEVLLPPFAGRLPNMSTKEPAIEERRLPWPFGEGRGGELRSEDDMIEAVWADVEGLDEGILKLQVVTSPAHQGKPNSVVCIKDRAVWSWRLGGRVEGQMNVVC